MKFEEALKLLREGKKIRRRCWIPGMVQLDLIKKEVRNNLGEIEAFSTEEILADDWEEYREPLLNDFEKDMLGDICHYYKKFKETSVERVRKIPSLTKSDTEFLRIYFNTMEIDDYLDTPHFEKGTMFKKIELGKYYKIEELELD